MFGKSRRPAASPHCTAAPNVAVAVHANAGLRRSNAQEAALLYLLPAIRRVKAIVRRMCRRLPLRFLFRRVTHGYEIRSWYKRVIW